GNAKVLFDAHEYSPAEFEESWQWRLFFQRYNEYLCRRYLPLADAATTVCEGIAEEYRRTIGVRMTVIHNALPYQDLQPCASQPVFRLRAGQACHRCRSLSRDGGAGEALRDGCGIRGLHTQVVCTCDFRA